MVGVLQLNIYEIGVDLVEQGAVGMRLSVQPRKLQAAGVHARSKVLPVVRRRASIAVVQLMSALCRPCRGLVSCRFGPKTRTLRERHFPAPCGGENMKHHGTDDGRAAYQCIPAGALFESKPDPEHREWCIECAEQSYFDGRDSP